MNPLKIVLIWKCIIKKIKKECDTLYICVLITLCNNLYNNKMPFSAKPRFNFLLINVFPQGSETIILLAGRKLFPDGS